MLSQFIADVSALLSAIQSHVLSSIVVAAIGVVSFFSSTVGSAISSLWSKISGLFGGNQPPAPPAPPAA